MYVSTHVSVCIPAHPRGRPSCHATHTHGPDGCVQRARVRACLGACLASRGTRNAYAVQRRSGRQKSGRKVFFFCRLRGEDYISEKLPSLAGGAASGYRDAKARKRVVATWGFLFSCLDGVRRDLPMYLLEKLNLGASLRLVQLLDFELLCINQQSSRRRAKPKPTSDHTNHTNRMYIPTTLTHNQVRKNKKAAT